MNNLLKITNTKIKKSIDHVSPAKFAVNDTLIQIKKIKNKNKKRKNISLKKS